jgi:hypothetical protein
MKKSQKALIGFTLLIITLLISSTTGVAASFTKKISVLVNFASISVNGKALSKDNIIYNNKVYVNAEALSKAMDKTFSWNKKNKTVRISDKAVSTNTAVTIISTNGQGKLLKIAADSTKGFNYAYFLFIPNTIDKTKSNRLMAECNNTGYHKESLTEGLTEESATMTGGYDLALQLNIPFLFPAFPRPADGSYQGVYTHDLGRTTLTIPETEKLGRIDLQMVAMIKDAQSRLAKEGITVEYKVLLYGFSASSHFANRFALLHPDMVRAVATGGINSLPILPVTKWSNTSLRYPLGIADLKEITGIDFNMAEYKKVAQYIFMGDADTNDTAAAIDCFEPQDTQMIYKLFGKQQVPDRFNKMKDIFSELEIPAQFALYKNVGHWGLYGKIKDDVVIFFEKNLGNADGLVEIPYHENPVY